MNETIKNVIFGKIVSYDKIIISRHVRPDGDAVGSTKGLAEILKASFPEKQIFVSNEDYAEYLAFLGGEDGVLPDEAYEGALVIVLDTASVDRISNSKIGLAAELIKIDHHIDIKPYGDVSWVEDWRSSLCEMIVDFYMTFSSNLTLTKEAALYLYTGMVTDSGRFKFSSVSGDTMRCAATLLDKGINVDWIFANLNLDDFDWLKFKAYAYKKMGVTENGVAYLVVDKKMQLKFDLSLEEASNSVSLLDSIKGSIIWAAFIENEDGTFRVRLRSRFVHVNPLAEKYDGGGHECACGAKLSGKSQIKAFLADADELIKTYKQQNEGWL